MKDSSASAQGSRERNEDAYVVAPRVAVYAIADGMSGRSRAGRYTGDRPEAGIHQRVLERRVVHDRLAVRRLERANSCRSSDRPRR
jgi:serine/threonine protein phosphatase PrpC